MAAGPIAAAAAVPGSKGWTSIMSPVTMVNVCSPVVAPATTGAEIVKRLLPTVTVTVVGIFRVTALFEVKLCVVVTVRGTAAVITPMVRLADVGMPMTMFSVVKLEPVAAFDMVTVPAPGFVADAAPAPITVTVVPTGI